MQLRTLEIFCTVADQRSFSKASVVHGVTQSAVSQSIQHLEESLGIQLIDRTQRPLVLTEAGHTYRRGLRSVLRSYHQLEQEVRGVGKRLSGCVTVGTIYSVGLSYMPEAMNQFRQLHPDVEVRTEFGSSQRVVEMTRDGEVDFGLVSFPQSTKHVQYVLWQQEPMRLVCSAEHPLADRTEISLSELEGIEMVGFERSLVLRREIDSFLAKEGVKVDLRMEFDNCDSMVRAIQANRGIGFVPEAAVHRETATGSLRVVACREFRMTRPLGIICRQPASLRRAAAEFGSLLLGRPLEAELRQRSASGKSDAESRDRVGISVVA